MKRTCLIVALSLIALQSSQAQVPQTISYHGVLTEAAGNVVSDSNYNLSFKLYNAVTGGTLLWSEQQSVEVTGGLFNVILGRVNLLTLSFDRTYWLGITVGQGSELSPRIELTASAYSLNARAIADSIVTSGSLPVRWSKASTT